MEEYQIITDVKALKQKSEPIDLANEKYEEYLEALWECFPYTALGLAAPQLGIFKRIFVARISKGTEYGDLFAFINPSIATSEATGPSTESCLSLPDVVRRVTRYLEVTVKADKIIRITKSGPYPVYEEMPFPSIAAQFQSAFIIQHEYDHLEGILITDLPVYTNDKAAEKSKKRSQKIASARMSKKTQHKKKSQKISRKQAAKLKKQKKDDKRERKSAKKRVEIQERYRAIQEGLLE